MPTDIKETILVSACLLSQRVRYDGNHAQLSDSELLIRLHTKFTVIPICPEMLGGLPTPRPPAEVQQHNGRIKVVDSGGLPMTAAFTKGAQRACAIAMQHQATRALLKSKSPSCGRGVVYDGSFTGQLREGDGITVQYLQEMGVQVYHEGEINLLLEDDEAT